LLKYKCVTSALNGDYDNDWSGWETNTINLNSDYIVSTITCYYSSYSRTYDTHGDAYHYWRTTLHTPTGDYHLDNTGLQISLLDGSIIHTWN
jgi:hypothetical protein